MRRVGPMSRSSPRCQCVHTALASLLVALACLGSGCSRSRSEGTESETRASPLTRSSEPPAAGAAPTKITVAAIAIVDTAPLYLAKAKGFFAEQNLDITVQSTTGGHEAVPCVVSGQCQLAFANVISLMLAHAKGLPLKVIAAGSFSTGTPEDFGGIVVPAGSPVKTVKDLEGKTVSVNQINNIVGVTVRAAMRRAGGDPDKVKLIEVSFPEMPAALDQKRVDAACIVEPFLTVVRNQGATVLDWTFANIRPTLMIAAYFTTPEYAQKNPDVVKRFTVAINKSLTYASEHPDEARATLLTYTKIDKAIVAKLNLPLWTPHIDRESMKMMADLMVQDKMVTSKPDIDALLP
jgi:NitT/TauT family transport system substrate-binding protein